MKKPQAIRSILESALKNLEIDGHVKAYSIWGSWEDIVGPSVALQSQPRVIRNRILFVDVSHPTWIHQLQFLKPTLLEKINTFLGGSLIEDIRFRLGKITSSSPSSATADPWQKEQVDEKTLKRIDTFLGNVHDPEAKRILREVFIKGAKLERYRRSRD